MNAIRTRIGREISFSRWTRFGWRNTFAGVVIVVTVVASFVVLPVVEVAGGEIVVPGLPGRGWTRGRRLRRTVHRAHRQRLIHVGPHKSHRRRAAGTPGKKPVRRRVRETRVAAEAVRIHGLVVGKVAELVSDERKTSSAAFAREKAPSGHHSVGHLLHAAFLAALILEPNLRKQEKKFL